LSKRETGNLGGERFELEGVFSACREGFGKKSEKNGANREKGLATLRRVGAAEGKSRRVKGRGGKVWWGWNKRQAAGSKEKRFKKEGPGEGSHGLHPPFHRCPPRGKKDEKKRGGGKSGEVLIGLRISHN